MNWDMQKQASWSNLRCFYDNCLLWLSKATQYTRQWVVFEPRFFQIQRKTADHLSMGFTDLRHTKEDCLVYSYFKLEKKFERIIRYKFLWIMQWGGRRCSKRDSCVFKVCSPSINACFGVFSCAVYVSIRINSFIWLQSFQLYALYHYCMYGFRL